MANSTHPPVSFSFLNKNKQNNALIHTKKLKGGEDDNNNRNILCFSPLFSKTEFR